MLYKHYFSAIIITGGDIDSDYINFSTVEVLRDNGSSWCSLPNLPDNRQDHSQSGLVTCGGWHANTGKYCLTFNNRTWNLSHNLLYERQSHSSWSTSNGIILMSSRFLTDETPTELITQDGLSKEHFTLSHATM